MIKVSFNNTNTSFYKSINEAADHYFAEKKLQKTGNWKLYSKTLILVAVALTVYGLILLVQLPISVTILLSLVLGVTSACIGFNVMHDANHGSYSSRRWVNETLSLSLNAMGGNSFIWRYKHNVLHHTYPNVDGLDDDIAKSPFIRMCPSQRWVPAHRLQHLYTPVLYALSSLIWVLFQDFEKYFMPRLRGTTIRSRMHATDHILFWISKLLYIGFYIVLPVLLTGWLNGLVFFVTLHVGLGLVLAIVFQLAHVVEDTEFHHVSDGENKKMENEWAIHQVQTTANFSPGNPVLSWLLGGLNYQVEHHLFPRVSHIHYPALSKIVMTKCKEFGLKYNCMSTFSMAVNSHFRQIKLLGKKPALTHV
jgi:linoleoyl-CoA desaturase